MRVALSAGRLSGCFTTLQATPTTMDQRGSGVGVTTLRAKGQSEQAQDLIHAYETHG
jgi:hypothetical protein